MGKIRHAKSPRPVVDARYRFGPDGHVLTIFQPRYCREDVAAVAGGTCRFGLVIEPPLVALLYRFGDAGPRGDAPFVWQLQPDADRTPLPRDIPGLRATMMVRLVGSEDGIVHAQRVAVLSEGFTRAFHTTLRVLARTPFDPIRCGRAVAKHALRPRHEQWSSAVARTTSLL